MSPWVYPDTAPGRHNGQIAGDGPGMETHGQPERKGQWGHCQGTRLPGRPASGQVSRPPPDTCPAPPRTQRAGHPTRLMTSLPPADGAGFSYYRPGLSRNSAIPIFTYKSI
ncbi:hypothetical protein KRMM14A1259_67660 [Krasilnikovia sp. MM14-A1259]